MDIQNDVNTINSTKRYHKKYDKALFFMILPLVALVIAFTYVPIFGWIYSFYDYKPGISLSKTAFVGLEHFIEIFSSSSSNIGSVLINTFALSFLGIFCTPVPVIFAILLSEIRNNTFKKIAQTITTLPQFISWIIVYSLFFALFSSEGVYNHILQIFNIEPGNVTLLGNKDIAWIFQTVAALWKSLGWNAIIYIAAIASIDNELYDAAKIDGAGRLKVILHIVIPGIIPTYIVLLLLNVSNMLSNGFDQYFVFYNPMVADKIEVLDYYVYKVGILLNDYPLATAIGALKTFVSVTLLFSVNFIAKRLRGESII